LGGAVGNVRVIRGHGGFERVCAVGDAVWCCEAVCGCTLPRCGCVWWWCGNSGNSSVVWGVLCCVVCGVRCVVWCVVCGVWCVVGVLHVMVWGWCVKCGI